MQLPGGQKRPLKLNGEEWTEIIYAKNSEGTVQPIFHVDMFIKLDGCNRGGKYQVLVGDPRMTSALLGNKYSDLDTPEAFDEVA